MSLFGVDIATIVSDALNGQLYPVTLKRVTAGNYDPSTDEETEEMIQTFTTEGVMEEYSTDEKAAGLAQNNQRKILLLAKPLGTVPQPGDLITIEGETLTVVGDPGRVSENAVSRDPASATFTVRGEL